MWPNPQKTTDMDTFTEQILIENYIFCGVWDSCTLSRENGHKVYRLKSGGY